MLSITLTPQGFFKDSESLDINTLKPNPVTLFLDGFPLDFRHESLKNLSWLERYHYLKTYQDTYLLQNVYFFFRSIKKAWVSTKLPHHVIQTQLDALTTLGIPVTGIHLHVFQDAKNFKTPTLHVKTVTKGTVRLLYIYEGLPYLVRYVQQSHERQEIQATLEYIQQTFETPPPVVTKQLLKMKPSFKYFSSIGSNKVWTTFIAIRLTLRCLWSLTAGGIIIGLYSQYQQKFLLNDTLLLKNITQSLANRLERFPHASCQRLHALLLASKPYLEKNTRHTWQDLYQKLKVLVSDGSLIQDISWVPLKELKLLVHFEGWNQVGPFQQSLYKWWPASKIQRLKHQDTPDGVLIQWHITL